MVQLFYTTYISVDIVHHEIFHAKVGKGGIKILKTMNFTIQLMNLLGHMDKCQLKTTGILKIPIQNITHVDLCPLSFIILFIYFTLFFFNHIDLKGQILPL